MIKHFGRLFHKVAYYMLVGGHLIVLKISSQYFLQMLEQWLKVDNSSNISYVNCKGFTNKNLITSIVTVTSNLQRVDKVTFNYQLIF